MPKKKKLITKVTVAVDSGYVDGEYRLYAWVGQVQYKGELYYRRYSPNEKAPTVGRVESDFLLNRKSFQTY